MENINQQITNNGNMINSLGNNNNNGISNQDFAKTFSMAKNQVEELDINPETKLQAIDMLEAAEESVKNKLFDKAMRFIKMIPDIVKSIPAAKVLIEEISLFL